MKNLQEGAQQILDVGGGSAYMSALFHQVADPHATIHYMDNDARIVAFARDNLLEERPEALDESATKRIILHRTLG